MWSGRRARRARPGGLAVALAALATVATGCRAERGGGEPEVWRFAIEETRGSVQDHWASRFKEMVEARTDGEVRVIIYPYGTLGTSVQLTQQLHNGTVELAMASPGHLGKTIPEVQLFLMHFLLSEEPKVNHRALADPELREELDAHYRDHGLTFLSAFSEGWMVWTTNEPIRKPDDFAGFKMRVMSTPLLMEAYRAYGASPTPLAYSEVYSALQLNMIDGQVNPVFAIEEMSFYEVTEHMIFPRHLPFIATVAANEAFFDGLAPDRREMVEGVVAELHDEIFEHQRELNRSRLEAIRDARPELEIHRLDEAERGRFAERAAAVREMYLEMVGASGERLLRTVEEAVARAEEAIGAGEGGETGRTAP